MSFDLNADDGSVRVRAFRSPVPGGPGEGPRSTPLDKLDSPQMQDLHRRWLDQYVRELDRQHDSRLEMANDEDFYDSIQWTEEDAAALAERGQKPLVYNVIAASVDWVTNTERRARSDHKVLPRRKADGLPAQRKTELMKYLSDVNRTPFHVSRSFTDSVRVGIGWIEDGITDAEDEEPLYARYESWRSMVWDSHSTEMDLSDARYVYRTKWVDLDVACAMFPKRRGLLEESARASQSVFSHDDFGDHAMDSAEIEGSMGHSPSVDRVAGYHRERLRLIEGWIRLPVETKRLKGGAFSGEIYDAHSPGHRWSLQAERGVSLASKVLMRMHVAIFTHEGLVWFSESPYRHNRFPFTPIWGKRRGRDGLPYGMVRALKGMQEDINKRASKALYILSTNKVIMDEDALPRGMSVEQFRTEVSRPDAILLKKPNAAMTISADRELSQYQYEIMSRSIAMIQQTSGVTDELLGRRTNATSGVAIQRRQDQGSMATAGYFDNLRLASQVRGEKVLANIEQFMSEEKAFRITSQRGEPEYVTVNDGLPDNDIVRSKADFLITDADWRATMRQAAVDELIDLMVRLPPQVALVMLDLVVENMDLINRDELVRRIRSITGQRDPDAEEPSEEEMAQAQARQEADQLARATLLAQLAEAEARTERSRAEAERIRAQVAGAKVDAQHKALEAGALALGAPPAVVHTADHILAEAGFIAASDANSPPPGAAPQAPPPEAINAMPGLMGLAA